MVFLVDSVVFKSNNQDVNAQFATDDIGRDIFKPVMSKERFQINLNVLLFDDFSTTVKRKLINVATAISDIFEEFVSY